MASDVDFTITNRSNGRNIMISIDNDEFTIIQHIMVVGFFIVDRPVDNTYFYRSINKNKCQNLYLADDGDFITADRFTSRLTGQK